MQWSTIWKLIFPDAPTPSSVYFIESQWEETFKAIRNLWGQNRHTIAMELFSIGYMDGQDRLDGIFLEILDRLLSLAPPEDPVQCPPRALQSWQGHNMSHEQRAALQANEVEATLFSFDYDFSTVDLSKFCNPNDLPVFDFTSPSFQPLVDISFNDHLLRHHTLR